jgi:hypothetical protein
MRLRGLVVSVAALGALVAAGPALGARTFTDGTGDQEGDAPDITTVTVDHDASGTITFRVDVANQPALDADSALRVLVDADGNPDTGSPADGGSEYAFEVTAEGGSFQAWNGVRFAAAPAPTARFRYDRGLTLTIGRAELGRTSRFNFFAVGLQARPGSTPNVDLAPDDGYYRYELVRAVRLGALVLEGGRPRAGRTWTLRVRRVRIAGTNRLVVPARVRCRVTLAGSSLRGTAPGGCTFRIPAGARGWRLTARITVAARGVSRTYAYRFTVA